MWGVFKPSVIVRIRSMQWKRSGIRPVAVGISRTSGQISLKISVAMNDRYSHHKSVWAFRSIIDIAIHLITLKYLKIIVTESERYLDQTVWLLVMNGNQWLRVAKMASQQPRIESKKSICHLETTGVHFLETLSYQWFLNVIMIKSWNACSFDLVPNFVANLKLIRRKSGQQGFVSFEMLDHMMINIRKICMDLFF